jgi:2-polyprenyl-3-methyl-5-hydroxy-6-metoxy-1,4-benzoquinol methylase
MPYFGAIWPAAESLVARLLADPPLVAGGAPLEVLDLGCGLGACGFAAARRGARVTFMDWEPRALEIVEASALRQELPIARFRFVSADWRRPPKMGPFARILGADVLYEDRNAPAVADFLARHLAPGAEAWITDPNRPHARRFPDLARRAGLEFLAAEILPAMKHAIDVTLLRLRRPD